MSSSVDRYVEQVKQRVKRKSESGEVARTNDISLLSVSAVITDYACSGILMRRRSEEDAGG